LLPSPAEALPVPDYELITNMIASWATRTPTSPAICQAGQQWSYHELLEQSELIAQALVALGVGRGDVVAVSGRRSFGLIAAATGVLMGGTVLLMLDANLPALRRQMMLQQAEAKCLFQINDQHIKEPESQLTTIPVNPTSGRIDGALSIDQQIIQLPTILPDDPAYLFFTSGTSGVPKGVLGCHKGLSHFLTWQRTTFDLGPGDRSAQLTGLSFDVVLRDIFLPLTSGATLYLPEEELELFPARIILWLAQEQITTLHIVPALAQSWLNDAPPGVSLSALRRVFFAGEPLKDTLVHRWREVFSMEGEIINLYGPTETTLAKCYYRVPDDAQAGVQPVGWPLPETQVLVFGKDNRLCAPGEPGEIVIRTPFRTLGYINAPEENWRFAQNPWRDDMRDILYYSGDRGRYALDGKVEILGRLDQQIKLRGIRIELSEVENALMRHPAVQEAAVLLYSTHSANESRAEDQDDKYLLAYIVPAALQPTPAETELRDFLKSWLPASMIPSAFMALPALPLTPNGKLDRRALPVPEHIFQESGRYAAPRTPAEELVAGIWEQVLKRDAIGIHDNFFALGGHSLLGVRIVSRLRNTFQVELPLRALFEAPTVSDLARRVEQALSAEQSLPFLSIKQADREGELPLSFTQQRLWFLDQWEPDNPFFNISRSLALHGPLDIKSLEWSFNEIIQRHEALRTSIVAVHGRPQQIIVPQLQLALPAIELGDIPEGERATEIQRRARIEAQRPFDLSHDPLIRVILLRLDETEHVLLLTLHHIISDAWSLEILLRELQVHYDNFVGSSDRQISPPPALPVQYVDFTIWQRERLQSHLNNEHGGETLLEQQLSYWREHLRGAPPLLLLPTDRPHPPKQTFQGAQYRFVLPQAIASDLKALSQREGVTLFMTLLAAFQTLLFRYTGQEDLVIGSTNANRTRVEIENLIGCFFDIQALRTDLSGNPTFRELLERVREVALGAYTHQELPFGKVVEELQPERSLSHSPFFQVAFALQHIPATTMALANLTLDLLEIDTGAARLDLMIFLGDSEQKLIGIIEYNTDLFDESTIARLVEHYRHLLEGVIANPDQRIASLPLLSDLEREQALHMWDIDELASPLREVLRPQITQLFKIGEPDELSVRDIAKIPVYLLDLSGQPVPPGIPGELYLCLSHDHPSLIDLDIEQCSPCPFHNQPGTRLSHTGILARHSQLGSIEYLGRVDQQVEVRGYRVNLNEIESLLLQHPAVQDCLVLPRENASGVQLLVAYVLLTPENQTRPAELEHEQRHMLELYLPDYMLPAHFFLLNSWPLAPDGRPDQQALLHMLWEQEISSAADPTSYTATEATLIEIWTWLLDPEEVQNETAGAGIGIHDDFFALGGHSLLATQVMSRVQETFQVELSLHVFFEASTIAELAEHIDAAQQIAREQQAPPLVPVSRERALPLSFAQERLWFLEQIASNSTAYTVLMARRIRGNLNIFALERSLMVLIERHEALRTTIALDENGPVQIIAPALAVSLPVSDLAYLQEAEREAEVQRLATLESSTPFDLSRGPLLRARLLRVEELQHVLLITIHHIASDGWSQSILYRELETLYTAFCQGYQASLPPLSVQYADYAVWQRNWLQG
ncbi:MAG TPA: amino acid adenylation domain-containing protein, partial [Ktedonobacteraceae bacterium]|nr:amino acid adenylation domain-containing protein [Ktedonobacteraceae bacterium]